MDLYSLSIEVAAAAAASIIPTYISLKVIFAVAGLTQRLKAAYDMEPVVRRVRLAAVWSVTRNYAVFSGDPWLAHEYLNTFYKSEAKTKQ